MGMISIEDLISEENFKLFLSYVECIISDEFNSDEDALKVAGYFLDTLAKEMAIPHKHKPWNLYLSCPNLYLSCPDCSDPSEQDICDCGGCEDCLDLDLTEDEKEMEYIEEDDELMNKTTYKPNIF